MALKTLAILALLAVCASATNDDHQSLDQKLAKTFTAVDCLLGKPNCPSPPPSPSPSPPPSPSPSPPPPTPTTTPVVTPPVVQPPVVQPPVVQPPALPPTAPGSATLTIRVNTPTPLTPAQKDQLAALLSARFGVNVEVVNIVQGRKLLAPEVETYSLTNIRDCDTTEQDVLSYINGPDFVADANAAAIPVPITSSEVLTFICGGAGSAVYPPATLPPVPGPLPGPLPLPPVPALAPGPLAAESLATSLVGFNNPGPPLGPEDQQELGNAFASLVGPGVTATVTPVAGRRHLLQAREGITITLMNVMDCTAALQSIQDGINSGKLESILDTLSPALAQLSGFQLGSFACVDESKPNSQPITFVNDDFTPIPPATAPTSS